MKIETPLNYLAKIEDIYAVLSVDEGGEGVVAAPFQHGMLSMPLIAADKDRLKSIMPIARMIARETGRKLRVVKFTQRVEIEEILP